MNEKPILFSGPMVRAILDGRKTQTRRVIKPQPKHMMIEAVAGVTVGMDRAKDGALWYDADCINPGREVVCPYGAPGTKLWVKETFAYHLCRTDDQEEIHYRADGESCSVDGERIKRWKPSIFMPRRLSRITLEIINVRVERVQEITTNGVIEEGAFVDSGCGLADEETDMLARDQFRQLWDSINAKRGYSWAVNPYVWVLEFRIA